MTYTALSRWTRKTLSVALVAGLALGTTASALAETPAPDLLTTVGGWEKGQTLGSSAAVEGLAVEPRTDLLHRGAERLRFQDFDGRVFEAELDRIERSTAGATTWIGRVSEFGGHSQVLLTTYEGAMAGYFDTPEGRYEIAPRPGGHVLIKLDASRFAGCDTEDPMMDEDGQFLVVTYVSDPDTDFEVWSLRDGEVAGREGLGLLESAPPPSRSASRFATPAAICATLSVPPAVSAPATPSDPRVIAITSSSGIGPSSDMTPMIAPGISTPAAPPQMAIR